MEDNNNNADISKILGTNIKQIRSLEGISQEQLAERISKSSHFISLLERGECGLSISTLIDICRALNTDTNSIFVGILEPTTICSNSLLNKSFKAFDTKDKEMVSYLINYINSIKH